LDINTFFVVKKMVITPNQTLPLEIHQRKYEMIFVLSGEGTISINHKANIADSGKYYVIEPGSEHKVSSGDVGLVLLEVSNLYSNDTLTVED
jgi:mannose-6-phosphate isomerase-like protein (cupin superfamily)